MRQNCGYTKEDRGPFIEGSVGQERHAGEPQSTKSCEECLYFNRDLASDEPCGICYESVDKFNWEKSNGDAEPGEMEPSDYRVCEACPG